MMKMHKSQQGVALYAVLFWIILLVFVFHTLFKLLPVYIDDLTIKSSLQSLNKDPDASYQRPADISGALFRRFEVNNIRGIGRDKITVVRDGEYYIVNIDYDVTIPYMANISLLMEFSHQTEVRAR